MLDDTKPRLIVMGGTTEPGVFQVEVMEEGPAKWSILHASEWHRGLYQAPAPECKCDPIYVLTDESARRLRKALNFAMDYPRFFTCACQVARVD